MDSLLLSMCPARESSAWDVDNRSYWVRSNIRGVVGGCVSRG